MKGRDLLKFRCTGCGNCCGLRVVVTDEDVRRLLAGTGLPINKIVKFYDADEVVGNAREQGWVRFGPDRAGRRVMALLEGRDGNCKFLKDDRCVVYEHRPVTCRMYPFNLEFDDTGRRVTKLEINDAVECPFERDGHNTLREIKRIHFWDDAQDDTYFTKVRAWNRRRPYGTEKEFLAYLGLIEETPAMRRKRLARESKQTRDREALCDLRKLDIKQLSPKQALATLKDLKKLVK